MKILLIGNGGREHAIAEAFSRSPKKPSLIVMGTKINPGINTLAASYELVQSLSDEQALKQVVIKHNPDMAFIGPDNPIGDGMGDVLEGLGVPTVAPFKKPAKLESSKGFTRELLEKYGIPGNPKFQRFDDVDEAAEFLVELGEHFVVKADGLAFGKGVKVSGDHLSSHQDALHFVEECLGNGHHSVVIEEKLVGVEFSMMAFCDGQHLSFMPLVQDHKRAFEGDTGPNTGGMGSYSDVNHNLPFLTEKDVFDAKQICHNVIKAVFEETGEPYKGILYGGFMAVREGVKLIEFNARFGDPEAMNVLPILETDFLDICQAILHGRLDQMELAFASKATVCLYIVPEGYPDHSKAGETIQIAPMPQNSRLYYSSVHEENDRILTTSSRSLGIVGIGNSLEEARLKAVDGLGQVTGAIAYRKDIGSPHLLQQRIDLMKSLRGIQ